MEVTDKMEELYSYLHLGMEQKKEAQLLSSNQINTTNMKVKHKWKG